MVMLAVIVMVMTMMRRIWSGLHRHPLLLVLRKFLVVVSVLGALQGFLSCSPVFFFLVLWVYAER